MHVGDGECARGLRFQCEKPEDLSSRKLLAKFRDTEMETGTPQLVRLQKVRFGG